MHERFGLTMDSSIFYRGCCFEKKTENIFGLTEELIRDFLDAKQQEEYSRLHKKKRISPTKVQNDFVQKAVPTAENQ